MNFPQVGSKWKHTSGNIYTVICVTNIASNDHDRYPITVVYTRNDTTWSRALADWDRSMTILSPQPIEDPQYPSVFDIAYQRILDRCSLAQQAAVEYNASREVGQISAHKVYLSRRNLNALLSKLDRKAQGQDTQCTIIKRDDIHPTHPQTMSEIYVTAVEDQLYYKNRAPGRMTNEDNGATLSDLVKRLFNLLDIREESDSGRVFSPNYITSCRVMDGEKLGIVMQQLRSKIR